MSLAADNALDRASFPWLAATALATTAPHALHQPFWLSALSVLLLLWATQRWRGDLPPPARWAIMALVALASVGILVQFKTLFGRDAGVAMLVVFMTMKLLEVRARRDGVVVVTLGYFLLLTHYLYAQDIWTGLWLLATLCLVTATLVRLTGGPACRPAQALRYGATLCAQAIPFMLVLYLLFPRVSGPLWGLPNDAHAGLTGLSDSMSPGSISRLAQSADIAFRARFDAPPPRQKLYWRGPVLERYDGQTWRPNERRRPPPEVQPLSPPLAYETIVEATNQRWLLALDAPVGLPEDSRLDGTLSVLRRQPLVERRRFRLTASLDYRFNVHEDATTLDADRALPPGINPRARALAAAWRAADAAPEAIASQALALFAKDFHYTLQPPLLGENGIDDFLFSSQRGFCEHYAAAFVFLMRAAGIPARVVTGYQGGELNPVDGYLVVRQSDAHAWAEIWIAGRGWVRYDPTAAVSPARIESGIADALPSSDPLPALVQLRSDWLRQLRYRWEAVNNAWNRYVIGYDVQRQRELLSRLGLPDADWRTLGALLAGVGALLAALTAAWTLRRRPPTDPAQKLWQEVLRQLRRSRVDCAPWETPATIAERVALQKPALADAFRRVANAYVQARYSPVPHPNLLNALREAVTHWKRCC